MSAQGAAHETSPLDPQDPETRSETALMASMPREQAGHASMSVVQRWRREAFGLTLGCVACAMHGARGYGQWHNQACRQRRQAWGTGGTNAMTTLPLLVFSQNAPCAGKLIVDLVTRACRRCEPDERRRPGRQARARRR